MLNWKLADSTQLEPYTDPQNNWQPTTQRSMKKKKNPYHGTKEIVKK